MNSPMGKWRLNFPLPFHHMVRTILFSLLLCSCQYNCLHFVRQLTNYFSIESIISFPKPMRKVSFHFLFLSLLHSLLSNQRGMKGKAIYLHFLLPGSPLCLFTTYYFNPLLTICSTSLLQQQKKISFFPFSSESKAWTSRRAMCPAHPLNIVSSHKTSSGNHYSPEQGNQTQHVQRHQKSSNSLLELPQVFPGSKIYFNTVR